MVRGQFCHPVAQNGGDFVRVRQRPLVGAAWRGNGLPIWRGSGKACGLQVQLIPRAAQHQHGAAYLPQLVRAAVVHYLRPGVAHGAKRFAALCMDGCPHAPIGCAPQRLLVQPLHPFRPGQFPQACRGAIQHGARAAGFGGAAHQGQPKAIAETLEGLKDASGQPLVPGIFAAVPYCIDLIGGPYLQTHDAVCKAFRPKSAVRPQMEV